MEMNDIHDESTAYEENLIDDEAIVAEALVHKSIDIKLLSWDLESVQAIMALMEPFRRSLECDVRDLMTLMNRLGKIGRKLDLTGSSATQSVMAHLYGLCVYAETIIKRGGLVHLIEATGPDGEQYIRDADLMYSSEFGSFQVDYTNADEGHYFQITDLSHDAKGRAKMAQLKTELEPGFEAKVVTCNVPRDYFSFIVNVPINHSSPREDDFKFADRMINAIHGMEWDEAKSALMMYANHVAKASEGNRSMIDTPRLFVDERLATNLINISCINSASAARIHKEFLSALRSYYDANELSRPKIDRFYGLSNFERYESLESKKMCPLPPMERGHFQMDPFERLKAILMELEQEGETPLVIWKMIANCSVDEKITGKSVSMGLEPDASYMSNVQIQRLKANDGNPAKAFKLFFPANKGLNGLRELIKTITPYDKTSLTHAELEREFEGVCQTGFSQGPGSNIIDQITLMVPDIGEPSEPVDLAQKFMLSCLNKYARSHVVSQLSQLQEIAFAIDAGKRKCRAVHGKKGSTKVSTHPQFVTMSIETVSDLKGVLINNLGPLDGHSFTDVSYMVCGKFLKSHAYTYPTSNGSSRILSMSHAQLDWNVTLTHKAISWLSMIIENTAAGREADSPINIPKMPLFLMFINSNKFSQAAELVRYIFVNGISLSTGPRELLDKIEWYTPSHNTEQLYMLRMLKLMHTLSVVKAINKPQLIKRTMMTNVGGYEKTDKRHLLPEWNIAMPDDDRSPLNEQSLFDSFYVCKALTIQRYSKLTSEALVLDKQLDARAKYLELKSRNLPHEGRFLINKDEQSFLLLLKSSLSDLKEAQPFSPSPLVTSLGIIATCEKLKTNRDKTVGCTIKRVYSGLKDSVWTMNLADVMNNRGSVRSSGKHGLAVTAMVKSGEKLVKRTQNDRCYHTLLIALENMAKGVPPPPDVDWTTIEAEVADESQSVDMTPILHLSDKLWPLMVYFSANFAACVSKCVHKDQIGSREIAVLNAAARVMCRFSEMLARHIRDAEHMKGVYTNVIERKDKMEHIKRTLNSSNALRKMGKNVMYDSADCSKWGPSMMMHTLYLSVGSRVTERVHRELLRNCYSLFGNKVFKIPDEFFLNMESFMGEKTIKAKVANRLRSMPSDIGNLKNQIIYLEESMHQGICGCASSVMGADAHNLSDFCTDWTLKSLRFKTVTFITSDDYSRMLNWDKTEKHGKFNVGKTALAIHFTVMMHSGIKRNLQKSGLSDSYWEFNSEFFCPTGEIRPDIKSRLSYIDFSFEPDPYAVALRPMTMAAEFLRTEGSYVGACWTFVLNNHLAMIQNQSSELWLGLRSDIYNVPLELGGLIKPDVLKATVTSNIFPLLKNYSLARDLTSGQALGVFMDFKPDEPQLVSTDENKDQVKIPSYSRSSVISLCRRSTRKQRSIQEFLQNLPPEVFFHVIMKYPHGSVLTSLLACMKREVAEGHNDGSAMMLAMSLVNRDSKVFRVPESKLGIEAGLYSRRELHEIAIKLLVSDLGSHDFPVNAHLDTDSWDQTWDQTKRILASMKVHSVAMAPRHIRLMRFRERYTHPTFVKESLEVFHEKYLPKAYGGTCNVSPIAFLENKILLSERLRDITTRKQDFRMALRDIDEDKVHWCQKVMLSNFAGGCKLIYSCPASWYTMIPQLSVLDKAISLGADLTPNENGEYVDLFSSKLIIMVKRGIVKGFDITSLANALIGANDTVLLEVSKVQQLLLNLKMLSANDYPLVVSPQNLATSFPEKKFKSLHGVELIMRPLRSVMGTSGRELIQSKVIGKKTVYRHYQTSTKYLLPTLQDDEEDEYVYAHVQESEYVPVSVCGHMGFTVIKRLMDDQLLQVMSQVDMMANRYLICTKQTLESETDLLAELCLDESLTGLDTEKQAILDMVMGFRVSVGEEELKELQDIKIDPCDADYAGSEVSSYGDEFEMDDDDEMLAEMDAANERFLEKEAEAERAAKEAEWGSDSSVVSEDDWERPLSDTGMIRPSSVQYQTITTSTLTLKGRDFVLQARERHGRGLNYVYEIVLPFKVGKRRILVDKGDEHPIKQLIRLIVNSDLDDKEWAQEYIKHLLAMYPPIKAHLAMLKANQLDDVANVLPKKDLLSSYIDEESDDEF